MTAVPRASVIMRSKNAEGVIAQALAALFSQDFTDFELLVVDSGSTDGTLDIVRQYPCRLLQIEPLAYYPGAVLNNAIEQTRAELVVFQNSDAVPLIPQALGRLLAAFDDPQVDAAFARQLPRPGADPWVQRDYAASFPPGGPAPPWVTLSLPLAAMRKSAWRLHPFYTDAWASEDTEWGHWASQNGRVIRYVPEALVMHSHNYTLRQLYGRRFVEGEADAFIYGGGDSLPAMAPASSLRRAIEPRIWVLIRSSLSWRNCGLARTSLKTASTWSVFSFSAEKDTRPEVSPTELSTDAAIPSSSSSNSSPVRASVPPVRMTEPVICARPIFSGGSNRFPVRTRANPLTSGNSWFSRR